MIEILNSTPSTMDAARARVLDGRVHLDESGAPSAWGVLADEQTDGRGQRGRKWHSARGQSMSATYYVRHRFELPANAARIALMAGVVVAGLLQDESDAWKIGLKWPNDILVGNRKAGGILTEMVRAPDGDWVALVGIGLNISTSEFPEGLRDSATSLKSGLAGTNLVKCAHDLAFAIGAGIGECAAKGHDPAEFRRWLELWRIADATTGRRYETTSNGATVMGTAHGIDSEGGLLLRLDDGSVIAVTSASSLRESK